MLYQLAELGARTAGFAGIGGGGVGVPFTKPHVVPFQGLRVGESGLRA